MADTVSLRGPTPPTDGQAHGRRFPCLYVPMVNGRGQNSRISLPIGAAHADARTRRPYPALLLQPGSSRHRTLLPTDPAILAIALVLDLDRFTSQSTIDLACSRTHPTAEPVHAPGRPFDILVVACKGCDKWYLETR